jgi:hypothetical protein
MDAGRQGRAPGMLRGIVGWNDPHGWHKTRQRLGRTGHAACQGPRTHVSESLATPKLVGESNF